MGGENGTPMDVEMAAEMIETPCITGHTFCGDDYNWRKTVGWSDQFSKCSASSLESLKVKCLQLSSAPISMLGFPKRVGVQE